MECPLFRPESVEARRLAWLGRPMVLNAVPVSAFAAFSVLFTVGLAALLILGDYSRRVQITGQLLPTDGLSRLTAPQAGRIVDLRVQEGDEVSRDDVLYLIGIDSTTRLGNTQDSVSRLLRRQHDELTGKLQRQARIDRLEKARLADDRIAARREAEALIAEVAAIDDYLAQLDRTVEQQQDLLSRGLARASDVETRLQSRNAERARLAALKRERLQLDAQIASLGHEIDGFDLAAGERLSEIRRAILDVERELSETEALREITVRAPRDGVVTGILAQPGQTVAAADPLLTVMPSDRPLVAKLLVTSDAIGFLRTGSPVLLRYQAFPYQKFGQHPGRVAVISRAALNLSDLSNIQTTQGKADTAGPLYLVTVEPDAQAVSAYGREEPLQPGMQVEAHVLVDRRPLYQWILEPVFSLRGTLAAASGTGT